MVTPHLPFWEDRRRDETEKGATDANWPKTKVRMQKGAEASWFFRHFGQLAFLFRSSRVERGIRCIQYYETPPFFFFFHGRLNRVIQIVPPATTRVTDDW